MYRAWWCGGPFIVPFFDTVFTLCFEVYVSTFWLKGIFTTKGVAKIPNVIRQNWVAPANALGSFWLPVVYCASFAILALHVSRMIIAAKHARNPFHPGIMHFIFGFSILAILAFAGVSGMLAIDSINLFNIFKTSVRCTPLAGAVNQACVAARQFVMNNRTHGMILFVVTILMASFAIFGELVIIWSCLGTCVFGPHLLACDSVAVAGCGPCGPCGPTVCAVGTGCAPACSPTAIACVPGGPAGCTVENGPCCSSPAPVVINAAVPVPTCHPSGPNIGPVGGGSASAVAPASKTATHTSHSNPCHASAPLDSETQQKLAVENPVANTCQISINTGPQDKGKQKRPRRGHLVMNDTSTSSSSDGDSESHMPFGRLKPGGGHPRHCNGRRPGARDRCGPPPQPRGTSPYRRAPPPHLAHRCRSSPSATPSPRCRHRSNNSRFRRPPPLARGTGGSRSPAPCDRGLHTRSRRGRPHTCHSPGPPPRSRRPISAGSQYRPHQHRHNCAGSPPFRGGGRGPRPRPEGQQRPYPRSSSPWATRRRPPSCGARPLHAAFPHYTYAPGYSPEKSAGCAVPPPPFAACLPPRHLTYTPLPASPVPQPYRVSAQGPPRPSLSPPGLTLNGKPGFSVGLNGEPLDLPLPAGPRRNTFLAVV